MGNLKGAKRDFAGLEQRRFQAAELFTQGFTKAEVARKLEVSFASARRWHESWQANGRHALKKAGRAGRKPKLNQAQLDQLQSALAYSPQVYGIPASRWTISRVSLLINRLLGVCYHPQHVGRLMHSLGLEWRHRMNRRVTDMQRLQQVA